MSGSELHQPAVEVGANPFSRWAVLAIVLLGSALLIALLWMIGTGLGFRSTNDGQAHADGRGLNGYAAMADYLDRRGYEVGRARNPEALARPGLLVLTPPAFADGKEIDRIVSAHRFKGPTLVITPKWLAMPPVAGQKGAKKGWVNISGLRPPVWEGFLDDVALDLDKPSEGNKAAQPPLGWQGFGITGRLPRSNVAAAKGKRLVPLVQTTDHRVLAALVDDGGSYPALEDAALGDMQTEIEDEDRYPLVVIFEPDLVDNWGMAHPESARLIEALVKASEVKPGDSVVFDLTLNGFAGARNLLTLAFTPPFLAATLCLLLAALALGWRAFLRFGPPLKAGRSIAFGKRALVSNAAGFLVRGKRMALIGRLYGDHARQRLVQALALPRTLEIADSDAAIDRASTLRDATAEPFSSLAARLAGARREGDLIKAARDLHALERTLTR